MNILIINCGSSSQGFTVYEANKTGNQVVIIKVKARNVATKTLSASVIEWKFNGKEGSQICDLSSHRLAAEQIIAVLKANQISIDAIGHRFVHSGTLFDRTTRIDPSNMGRLKDCLHFAPIHNPNSYSVIEVCLERMPGVTQYVVFDTCFHTGMPEEAKQYAIPREIAEQYGFRKYGFHGLSYKFVSAKAAQLIGKPLEDLKLIICHLGTGGSSVAAVKDGQSLDTSMGYSPLPGLVMSTRCGDIDPEIVLELIRKGHTPDEVSDILNNRSGLIGLSGFSSNLEEIITEAEKGDENCRLAYDAYTHRLRSYLGAYTWQLDGADAIIFTDDVGLRSWKLREKVFAHTSRLGVELDLDKNMRAPMDQASLISKPDSKTKVWVVPTDEESIILQEVLANVSP